MLANPPYSISEWNRTSFENDKWGRNIYGVPPQGRADYAFISHIVASMNDEIGRCAILLPHGVLFRNEETLIRTNLIKSDKIEAVIGLGPNLFYNAPMEACVIVCNNNKPEHLKNKIIFINAKNEVTRKNAESYLEDTHITKIIRAYHSNGDIDSFKRIVDINEIKEKHFDLTIHKYVFINEITNSETLKLSDAVNSWKGCIESKNKNYDQLINLIDNAL